LKLTLKRLNAKLEKFSGTCKFSMLSAINSDISENAGVQNVPNILCFLPYVQRLFKARTFAGLLMKDLSLIKSTKFCGEKVSKIA